MAEKILILGGTKEAAALAQKLVEEGLDVTTSLAGRTREPSPLAGKTRVGGFGGVAGLADYLRKNAITRLIDATHPFARRISANALAAAQISGVLLDVRTRPPWEKTEGDAWTEVNSLEAAAVAVPTGARVLLALGSQHLSAFRHRTDVHFIIRMVDQPIDPLPFTSHELLIAKPSTDWREEAQLFKDRGITHIVCRNSGGSGAYAKIEAARELGLPVIILEMTQGNSTPS